MAYRKRTIALLAAGMIIVTAIGVGVALVGLGVLAIYMYSHAHDHREFAEPAPTLVGLRMDDGRLAIHLNLCGQTLQEVRVVSWEATEEPEPIWRGSKPRGLFTEPGTFRLGEAGQFGQVSGTLPRADAPALWVEVSTKQSEHYASSTQFAMASIPADLPPGVYWTDKKSPPRSALDIDLLAPCATPGAY